VLHSHGPPARAGYIPDHLAPQTGMNTSNLDSCHLPAASGATIKRGKRYQSPRRVPKGTSGLAPSSSSIRMRWNIQSAASAALISVTAGSAGAGYATLRPSGRGVQALEPGAAASSPPCL